jgi:hypothetical protein
MSLGVAFFRASAPDSGAAEAQFMDIATLAPSIAGAASTGTFFFISCSPVASPPKWYDRSAPASLDRPPVRAILGNTVAKFDAFDDCWISPDRPTEFSRTSRAPSPACTSASYTFNMPSANTTLTGSAPKPGHF